MPPGTLTSLPCLRPCSTDSRPLSKEGGERGVETHSHTEEEEEERERDTSHTHTHTHTRKHARKLPLHAAGGTCPRVVWHTHAAMLPRASSLTRVLPPPLSRVTRSVLWLNGNPALICVPLAKERLAAISSYYGPTVTCQVSCCASCVCSVRACSCTRCDNCDVRVLVCWRHGLRLLSPPFSSPRLLSPWPASVLLP